MNKNLLLLIIRLYGDSSAVLANAIGMEESILLSKMEEKGGMEFTQEEISKMSNRYKLSDKEMDIIFFT